MLSAVTRAGPALVILRPRQRVVAPFTGDAVRPGQHLAADGDPGARAGADDHAEHDPRAGGRAVSRLGHGKTVGVVGDAHLAAEACARGRRERPADQPDRVGVLDEAGHGEIVPGMPTPTVPAAPADRSSRATSDTMASSVAA